MLAKSSIGFGGAALVCSIVRFERSSMRQDAQPPAPAQQLPLQRAASEDARWRWLLFTAERCGEQYWTLSQL